jgi:serine/threonine protein phosphatase 1
MPIYRFLLVTVRQSQVARHMGKLKSWFSKRQKGGEKPPRRRRLDLGDAQPVYPIYAIGDIHGCIAELKKAEELIAADIKAAGRNGLVVLLGDYVDRGPRSRDVLDHLIKPSELGLKRLPICGNHDDIFLRYLTKPSLTSEWLTLGGEQTLMSYGIDLYHISTQRKSREQQLADLLTETIPASHRQFLRNLPISLRIGNLLFVHAGIRPGVALDEQNDEDLLWIREPFLSQGPELPFTVIHGHTPKPTTNIGPGRIGIDTGAYYTGKLAVLKIEGGRAATL